MLNKALLIPLAVLALSLASSAKSQPKPPPMSLADIRRFLNQVETDLHKSKDWKVAEGKYVNLNYLSGSQAVIRKDVSMMDLAVTRDCQYLKFELPKTKVPVYLFPDDATLSSALGMRGKFGSGVSLGDWAVIVAKPTVNPNTLAVTSAHEIGHALVHENLGAFGSAFFAEGIAFYLEARFQAAPWLTRPAPVEKTSILSLADGARTPADFSQGARFFDYLMLRDKNDPTKVKSVLTALNTERLHQLMRLGSATWVARVDRVFKTLYGIGLATLEAQWRAAYPAKTMPKRPS